MEGIEQKTTFHQPTADATSGSGKALLNVRSLAASVLIILVALFGWSCGQSPSDGSNRFSPEMLAIVKLRRSTNWEVSTAGLPQLSAQESEERIHSLESAGTMEVLPVRPKAGSPDEFNYVIWRDMTTNQYWIERYYGGLSGSTVVFGPGKIEQK